LSHRIESVPNAIAQVQGLPAWAFDALLERVLLLIAAPWDAMVQAGGIPAKREA